MQKVFLTPFLVLSLLLLPSCSSGSKSVSNTEEKVDCEQIKTYYKDNLNASKYQDKNSTQYKLLFLAAQYYLLENTQCFTAAEIATARAAIDVTNNSR